MLDATASTDPEVDPLIFRWDLNNDSTYGDVTSANPTVAWATLNAFGIDDNGTFTIGLLLDDGTSQVTDTTTLTVTNAAPTIALTGDATVDEGAVYTLTLGTVTDSGDDTASIYVVNWGDGSDQSAFFALGAVTHTYETDGAANISVLVVDEDGSHAAAGTKAITVNNVSPSVIDGTTETLAAINEDTTAGSITGDSVNGLFLSHYSDPVDDCAGIAVVANAENAVTQGAWEYSTDNGSTWMGVGAASAGSALVLAPSDQLRFVPVANFNGQPGALMVRLWDDSSGSAGAAQDISGDIGPGGAFSNTSISFETTINSVADAPAFTSSAVTAATEDSAYSYPITAADADAGDTLTITALAKPTWLGRQRHRDAQRYADER